jgi:hypothetical protein
VIMYMILITALNYLSWTLLCLSSARHYQRHFGHIPSVHRRRYLGMASGVPLILALGLSIHYWGSTIGIIIWICIWMLTAMFWVMLQAYRPVLARRLTATLLVLVLLMGIQW